MTTTVWRCTGEMSIQVCLLQMPAQHDGASSNVHSSRPRESTLSGPSPSLPTYPPFLSPPPQVLGKYSLRLDSQPGVLPRYNYVQPKVLLPSPPPVLLAALRRGCWRTVPAWLRTTLPQPTVSSAYPSNCYGESMEFIVHQDI